ncbi:MAG: hypothetical protein WCO44_07435 [Bacteroidota bacterium]
MHSTASFPYLVDYLLGDLEEASRIRIECRRADNKNPAVSGNLVILSVNGCNTSSSFLHLMEHLRAQTMDMLRENLGQVSAGDTEAFFGLLQRRLRKIIHAVVVMKFPLHDENRQNRATWVMKMVNCRLEGEQTQDRVTMEEAVGLTRRHAWIYYLVLKKLEEWLNSLTGASLGIMVLSKGLFSGMPNRKFRLSCTVSFFCAMLRLLCDRNIFENPNISELCRSIAAGCSTSRQENLSPHSLRNHFDDPSPETLEELLAEVHIWEKYITGFLERQRAKFL